MTRLNVLTLFSKQLRGETTESERRAVDALRQDSAHAAEFERFERTLGLATTLAKRPVPDRTAPFSDRVLRAVRTEPARSTGLGWGGQTAAGFAIAICTLIFIVLPQFTRVDHGTGTSYVNPPVTIGGSGGPDMTTEYNDTRVANSTVTVLAYIEGSFGALCILAFGLLAINLLMIGSFKRDRQLIFLGLFFLALALAAFLLRLQLSTIFNTESIGD